MNNQDWRTFFQICGAVLGEGSPTASDSESWCAWTTFPQLASNAVYWTAGIPHRKELGATHIADGGTWGQPFAYKELAHVIIPATFDQEVVTNGEFLCLRREQNIETLSDLLSESGIPHRKTNLVLEIKLF
jgi:hypothetical protein